MSDVNSTPISPVKTNALDASYLAPTAGQDVDAEDIQLVTQKLADGIHRIGAYSVPSAGSLGALTGLIDGEKITLRDGGLYVYDAASVAAVNAPWVYNGPGGIGRFLHVLKPQTESQPLNGKFAVADSLGFLATPFHNQVKEIETNTTTGAAWSPASTGSFEDIETLILTEQFTDPSTDLLEIDVCGLASGTAAPNNCQLQVKLIIGGMDYPLSETLTWIQSSNQNFSMKALHAPHLTGEVKVVLQGKVTASGVLVVVNYAMIAKMIRNKA